MSNRCGHNPHNLRLCDVVKRGKGGAPRILGILSGYLNDAAKNRGRLKAWHKLNPTGRGRRSEAREAMATVLQFLIANWFQLETRRCAMPGTEYLEVPDVKHMAMKISASPDWKGGERLSVGRIYAVLSDLVKAGYISRSDQVREQKETGEWVASPKITSFTKQFFLDLGGKDLWRSVMKAGAEKVKKITLRLAGHLPPGSDIDSRLARFFNPGKIFSPRQAYQARQARPPDLASDRPHLRPQIVR